MIGVEAFGAQALGELAPGDIFTPAVAPQYFSSHGFISGPADTPADTYYDERVDQPLYFGRSIVGDRIGGLATETGEMRLANGDGGLDAWVDRFAFDARRAVVRIGDDDFALDEYGTIFDGAMHDVEADEQGVVIRVRTKRAALASAIAATFYTGAGGAEGGDDIKGRMKPLCWGKVFNVPAIPVDIPNLLYQVHNGLINDVPAVYDRGIALTKVGGTPSPGQYSVDAAAGTFTLGGTPAGLVTADVAGRVNGSSVYLTQLADIVQDILLTYGPLSSGDLDADSFTALNAAQPATMGLWLQEPVNVDQVVHELLAAAHCFGTFTPLSVFRVGQFAAPAASTDVSIDAEDISAVSRVPLPDALSPLVWRYRVGWARNYVVQTDLASGVSDARRAFAAAEQRIAAAADAALTIVWQLARDPEPLPSYFALEADAEAEAARMLALLQDPHALYTIRCKPALWTLNVNDTVRVSYPRYRLNGGALCRVVGIELDAAENATVLTVFI